MTLPQLGLRGETEDVSDILWAIGRGGLLHGVDRLRIDVASPIDVIVTDPIGHVISKWTNEIDLAQYLEVQDNNGQRHDVITIPVAVPGSYQVVVVPEPGRSPDETFSIVIRRNDASTVLVQSLPLRDIDTEPYRFELMPLREIAIDIKPGDNANAIISRNSGRTPVAILSTREFDAFAVDSESVTFGRTGSEATSVGCSSVGEDVNGDFRADMVCHFATERTGLRVGDTIAVLKGQLKDGTRVVATDGIRAVR